MFPTAHSRIYYNEAGEPIGWDNPNYDEPPDPDDYDPALYEDPTEDECINCGSDDWEYEQVRTSSRSSDWEEVRICRGCDFTQRRSVDRINLIYGDWR